MRFVPCYRASIFPTFGLFMTVQLTSATAEVDHPPEHAPVDTESAASVSATNALCFDFMLYRQHLNCFISTVSVGCGRTSSENCTYFESSGNEVGDCTLTICKVNNRRKLAAGIASNNYHTMIRDQTIRDFEDLFT